MTEKEHDQQTLGGLYKLVENNTKVLEELTTKMKVIESLTLTAEQRDSFLEDMSEKKWRAKAYDKIIGILKNLLLLSGATAAVLYFHEILTGVKK